ncbi:MAG: hypothetical protein ABIB43_05535 [archaeon]
MADEFFRRIENPNDTRRNILESSRNIIQNLKGHRKILEIREKKNDAIRILKIELKEINVLTDKIRDSFPAELLKQFEEEKKKKVNKKKTKGKKTPDNKKTTAKLPEVSEVNRLEKQLSDIEKKLQNLS